MPKTMILESILDKKHPHATFHDAILYDLKIDYKNRIVQFEINMQIGNPEEDIEKRSKYALGCLAFSNFAFLAVEPPDPNYNYNKPNGLWIDEGPIEKAPLKEKKDFILTLMNKNKFARYFYVVDWNSFIYVVAPNANFKWLE